MKNKRLLVPALSVLVTGAALAHAGVKDPVVMARMQAMSEMGKDAKILGTMTKSPADFDADAAAAAMSRIAARAGEIPDLFEVRADDPESEARPAIWDRFDDFTAEANALETAATSASVATQADLRLAMAGVGKACGSCHEMFRE